MQIDRLILGDFQTNCYVVRRDEAAVDCLIVDPPRSGLDGKVHTAIAALKPRTVLYVSCNPPTQARDAGFLMKNAGYTVQHAALFDLYPNTHHIESILLLTHPS